MTKKRGYLTLEIGGKQRTMHFSMNFWVNFTEILKIPLSAIGTVFEGKEVPLSSLRAMVFSALKAYDQESENVIDYNLYTAGDWMSDLSADDLALITETLAEGRILGNDLNGGIPRNVKKSTKVIAKKK